MAATLIRLPLDLDDDTHELDALTARAVRRALGPDRPMGEVAAELCAMAHGRVRLLDAAIARVDRALAGEWSKTGDRALDELLAARALAGEAGAATRAARPA